MSNAQEDQDELVDRSWELVKEALEHGTMTLISADAKPSQRVLETESIIDLAKFFVTLKMKKPKAISKPEDFDLLPTDNNED